MFFVNIENAYSQSEKFADGCQIYNLDKSGTTVQKPKKSFGIKGCKTS